MEDTKVKKLLANAIVSIFLSNIDIMILKPYLCTLFPYQRMRGPLKNMCSTV